MHAYSTDNPDTLAAYRTAREATQAFTHDVVTAAAAIGNNTGAMRVGGVMSGYQTAGLGVDDPDKPPAGWVYSKGRRYLVPKRGKAGNEARQWLADHQPPADVWAVLAQHGLPRNDRLSPANVATFQMSVPTLFEHDGVLWAHYRGTPDGTWSGGAETVTWTPRKLSEYHAAREAAEAAAEGVKATP